MSCYIYAAGRCMGQGVGNTASVADHVQAFVAAFKVVVNLNFHVVEFNFHALQQSIVVCSSRSYFVQGVDHFDDAVQNTFRKYKT